MLLHPYCNVSSTCVWFQNYSGNLYFIRACHAPLCTASLYNAVCQRFFDMFLHEASLCTVVFELLPSLLLLSLPLFCFCFFVSVSPHFAITASTLLGGSLLCPCPVCNGSSTNPPSGNCSFPPSFVSSEPPSNTPFCQNRLRDACVKTLQTF